MTSRQRKNEATCLLFELDDGYDWSRVATAKTSGEDVACVEHFTLRTNQISGLNWLLWIDVIESRTFASYSWLRSRTPRTLKCFTSSTSLLPNDLWMVNLAKYWTEPHWPLNDPGQKAGMLSMNDQSWGPAASVSDEPKSSQKRHMSSNGQQLQVLMSIWGRRDLIMSDSLTTVHKINCLKRVSLQFAKIFLRPLVTATLVF